jgi:hypothetical protein
MKTVKIRVPLTIEVDPAEWDLIYGSGKSAAEIREDVRAYVLNAVQGQPGIEESGAVVTLA